MIRCRNIGRDTDQVAIIGKKERYVNRNTRYQESRARGTTISYLTFTLSGTETTKSVLDERSITPMTTTTTTTTTTINRSCRSGSDVQR
ncbi:uncharacterized protein [Mycetomoellerius zeteki]|uniref:uncharacterized protein isoform X2 n=1 Tax=Mycetomoellerius zeteki TaxID=64791 RepID=UPI00084E5CFD|nr:PREDICTED: uncharacterized protein LOC108724031 isoform X2 [Trachymyrmex zeteki]